MRIGSQHQRGGVCDVNDLRLHAGRVQRVEGLVEYAELRIGDRTFRIAGVGEQRADALEARRRRASYRLDHAGNVRWQHAEACRAAVDFDMNRKIFAPADADCAVEHSDHPGFENERRQVERDDLRRLLGEEARLQIHPRPNSRLAQLARLVERGDSEMTASFVEQRARDRHRAMPVSVGLDHHHQLAVRGHRAQCAKVGAQRAEIDLGDSGALSFRCSSNDKFPILARADATRRALILLMAVAAPLPSGLRECNYRRT